MYSWTGHQAAAAATAAVAAAAVHQSKDCQLSYRGTATGGPHDDDDDDDASQN